MVIGLSIAGLIVIAVAYQIGEARSRRREMKELAAKRAAMTPEQLQREEDMRNGFFVRH